ncbi:MAG: acyl-CoA dehydrogenase family protein [Burkholderiales bacterium]
MGAAPSADLRNAAQLEREALITRVRDLATPTAAVADTMERDRHMPASLARALADTGMYRSLRPEAIGGLECDPATALQAFEEAGRIEASLGWCAMIGATSGIYSAYLDPVIARQVYGEGNSILTAGVFAPMGQAVVDGDDYVVTGQWKWASGSRNCQWLNGGCTVIEAGAMRKLPNGAPEIRAMMFRAEDAELIDTWHTMGLCGTGSVDMKVQGVRVPRSRSVSLMADRPRHEGALYVFPVFGLLAMGIAAVASGNARAALDDFIEFASAARTAGSRKPLSDRGTAQAALAQAEAQYRSARAFLFDEVDQSWTLAQRDRQIPVAHRARLRLAATHMTRTAAEVVRTVHELGGGAAVFTDNRQQRRLRDAQTITAHMMTAPASYELAGRVLFGLPTDDTVL